MMTDCLVVFGLLGLFFIPTILFFIVCGVDAAHKIGGALVCLAFWILMTTGLCIESSVNEKAWNGGYCECGTHWELSGVAKSRNGSTTKYYSCPNCYAEITQ
jgi:hypothetical protein